ncbi:hypothetical protein GCM10022214_01270 [Actinomadura miaoliensis]|uniref:Uncharacterized protein n=1 Tax=Actinomadura miaoliensis TaxID=430685 RepID=A0ABP7UVZ9_9ACTN
MGEVQQDEQFRGQFGQLHTALTDQRVVGRNDDPGRGVGDRLASQIRLGRQPEGEGKVDASRRQSLDELNARCRLHDQRRHGG